MYKSPCDYLMHLFSLLLILVILVKRDVLSLKFRVMGLKVIIYKVLKNKETHRAFA